MKENIPSSIGVVRNEQMPTIITQVDSLIKQSKQSMLITLYGINNIGKSTQAHLIVKRLQEQGYDAQYVKFPVYDSEPSGPMLNSILREGKGADMTPEQLQTWFVLNRMEFQSTLQQWLNAGKIVIAEDYVGTGIAWGTVKGASTDWLVNLNAPLIKEDLAILIDGQRFTEAVEEGHLHESDDDLMNRSRKVHLELAERFGWHVVDLVQGVDAMHEVLWSKIQLHLPKKTVQ